MFGNPVVVRGFPIPRRADADTGLEVPLDMVAGLTNCRRVVNFAGMTFIKGFAAMLTAVKVIGDMMYWHLCYNADGSYMSYGDFDVSSCSEPHTLSLDSISGSRHIVGWSDNVRNYAGMTDPNFSPIFPPLLTSVSQAPPTRNMQSKRLTYPGPAPAVSSKRSQFPGRQFRSSHRALASLSASRTSLFILDLDLATTTWGI
jgi:hypothetical protein